MRPKEKFVPATMEDTLQAWQEDVANYRAIAEEKQLDHTRATAVSTTLLNKIPTLAYILHDTDQEATTRRWAADELDATHSALSAYTHLVENKNDLRRRDVHEAVDEKTLAEVIGDPVQYVQNLVRKTLDIPEKPPSSPQESRYERTQRNLETIYTLLDEEGEISPNETVELLGAFYKGSLETLLSDDTEPQPMPPGTRSSDLQDEQHN